MDIIRCDATQADAWNAYVDACPRATFYHRWEWRDVNAWCLSHESVHLAAVDDGRVVGIFPLVRLESRLFGRIACSMPFVNYGGPCGDDDAVERRLIEAARTVADEWDVDYLEIRSRRYLGDDLPSSDHKVSMTIALDPDPEVVMAAFKRDHRAEIRRAAKSGFTARFGSECLDDFYDVLSESWRDMGTPIFRADYLERIVRAFPGRTRICVVYDRFGVPAAGAFDGIGDRTIEGMWLGVRREYRRQLVGYVLYWELIRHACLSSATTFHLGRSSKDSGAEQFKRKWNAEAQQLYWHYVLRKRDTLPGLNPDNPKYQLAIRTWRQLPVAVTRAIGPYIARSIP